MRPIRVQVLIASLLLASGVHAADEPLFVEGSVRGAALETPADVLVELVPVVSQLESSRLLLAGEPSPPAVATAVPAADSGRFRLAVPMIGVYRVRLSAPDHLTMRTLPVPVTGALELPLLTLAAATTLETSIRDADGRPVADAWVVARAAGGAAELWRAQGSPGWLVAPRLARSGPDGRADVPRLAGEPLEIRIRLPGDATPRAFTEVGPRLDVRLEADTVTRRWITLEGAEAGTVVSVGRERWPVGELDVAGRLRLAGPFDDRVALHFLSAERPLQSVWLEPGDEQPVYSVLPAHRFTGRLVDSTGKPLVGALVWPSWDPGNQATTDESGGYAFNYPLSPRFEVRGAAPRLAPRSLALTYVGASRGAVPDLVLYPSSNAAGRIVDAAGRGVAGARVMAVSLEGASRRALAPVHATADRAGHFELRGLTPDSIHRLSAVQDGHFPTDLEVGGIRPGGRREGLRLALVARRGAFGRVVDVEDRPLAGIEVLVRPTGGHTAEPARVRTDPDGRFELGAMPAPKVDLIASGEGYAPLIVPGVEPGLGRGAIDLGTLMLTRGATIAGEVTAASGDPLDGVAVWISPQPVVVERLAWERLSLQPPDAVSADGQFSISGLSPGQRVDLVAYRAGFLPAVVRRVEAPAAAPVQVRLRPTARIAGRVLDQDLEPIEGALVALSASAMPEGVSAIPAPIEHDPERATRSGTDGIFEITGLLPGEVSLEVRAQGFQPSTRRHFEIVEGSLFDDLEVVLERGAVLEGLVTTAEGEPVEDALVAVGSSMASSGADGSFRVEGIATGQHTADARHPHFDRLQQKVEIEPGTNLLDFVFASAHRLAGRVVDERRSPVADARVELVISSRNDYREPHTLSDGQGRFDFPRLSAGTYRLQVEKEGWVADPPQLRIDLRGDDVDDLEVVLIPSIQLTGEVLGLDFTELAGVQVEAVTDDGQRRAGTVAYDGRYEIRDLGPGDWLVSAEAAEGTRRVETRLVLDPGDLEAYRDLEFEPGLVLSGRVEHGGEPVGAATIALLGSDVAARRDVLTDHDGQFRFEALESGSYRLSVSSSRDLFIHNEDVLLETDRDLLIELATAGLSGRVVAEDGGAIHRALVILQQRLPIADSGAGGEGSIFTVGSDSEGSFRFDRLPAGRFSVRIRKDGYAQLDEELELVAGGASEARTFTLEPTGGVELHLRLASGAVPPAALVTLLDDGGRPVQSEARGLAGCAARFETLQAGEWRAMVGAHGGAPREVRLTVPGDPVEIVLPDAGRLRVRVPDLFESPHRATVTLEDAGGQPFVGLDPGGMPQHTWSVDRGTATIEGVPAGQWILRLVGSGGGERTAAVATPGASEVEVVF